MQKLVIDSSVIVKGLNQQDEEHLVQADKIMKDLEENRIIIFAPELAKYEIGNALLMRKMLTAKDEVISLNTFFTLPIQFINLSEELACETYKIAQETNITYYDACFIALAKQENAVLVTDNPKHQGKNKKIYVISLSDY